MPYAWSEGPGGGTEEEPRATLRLWPHRSLAPEGFVIFVGGTAILMAVPLISILGTPHLWVLLPFPLLALGGIWVALRLSYRGADTVEELRLWPDRMRLTRHERAGERSWEANPHWVRAALHKEGGPVPNYLTLTGAGRTVEIGAFLSEDERLALKPEIEGAIARLR